MTPRQYQTLCNRTSIDEPTHNIDGHNLMIAWFALGLSGEAGEVSNMIKKMVFHQREIDLNDIKLELGDCLWYISELCTKLGWSLEEVMQSNIDKINHRYPDGWK